MKYVFSRTPFGVGSLAIRYATQGDGFSVTNGWSHCAVVSPDGKHVIDSMAFHGVRIRTLESYLKGFPVSRFGSINGLDDEAGWQWCLSQLGKHYDYTALAAFLAPSWMTGSRYWEHRDKWFCSEFGGKAALKGGLEIELPLPYLSPNDLASLCAMEA